MVTSMFRLKANFLHFAAHDEAPRPEHNHEAQTSKRTLTLAGVAVHRIAADTVEDERAARWSLFS
jgi:hypothetical protein